MGLLQQLQGANFVNPAYKIIRADRALNAGSLLLLDTTRLPAGIPIAGATLRNIAWEEAKAVIGSGDEESLKPNVSNSFTNGFLMQRTPKGAFHGMVSPTETIAGSPAWSINLPDLLCTYIRTRNSIPGNYAFFLWSQTTRISTISGGMDFAVGNSASIAGNTWFVGSVVNVAGTIGQFALNKSTAVGNPPASNGTMAKQICGWGRGAGYTFRPKSFVLYRIHIIDVAASGKTYSELLAEDTALFNEYFGPGGLYYGDTHSDPAVALP